MLLFNWLSEWKHFGRIVGTKTRRSSHPRTRAARGSSQAEILEERILLTDFLVTTLVDEFYDGDGNDGTDGTGLSLREAIGLANVNNVNDSVAGQGMDDGDTISFAPGLIGMGPITLTLGGLIILDDVAINGDAGDTGVRQITVDANGMSRVFEVSAGNSAGSIDLVVLQNLIIQNGTELDGGGIRTESELTLDNTQVTGNTATGSLGGGGVFNDGGTVIIQNNSSIDHNSADNDLNDAVGGGVFNDGGTVTIQSGSVIDQNTSERVGGGIYTGDQGTLIVDASTISNNVSPGGAGIAFISGSATVMGGSIITGNSASNFGGGIFSQANLTIDNSEIRQNESVSRGGGIVVVSGTTTLRNGTMVHQNTAGTDGGGIVSQGTLIVEGTMVHQNTAGTDGGGIVSQGTLIVEDSELAMNSAARDGGGIFSTAGTTTLRNGSTISQNAAGRLGGGIYTQSTLLIDDSDVTSNSATTAGGGIAFNAGTMTIQGGSTINQNTSDLGGGILSQGTLIVDASEVNQNTSTRDGGGIDVRGGTTTIQNGSKINSNTAGGNGGGIFNQVTLIVENSEVGMNSATGNGGGIYSAGTLTASFSTIGGLSATDGNTASLGAGIYNGGTLTINSATEVTQNSASSQGGGIYNTGTASLDGISLVFGNTAANNGGGLFNSGNLTVNNSVIGGGFSPTPNVAGLGGGGIYNQGTLTVQPNAQIFGNSAILGGGIFNTATATIVGTDKIASNFAAVDGGGIYNAPTGLLELADTEIRDNTANSGMGGGIENQGSLTLSGTMTVLDLNSPDTISGAGPVTSSPTGTVTFADATLSTYSGPTTLTSGTTFVNGTIDNDAVAGNSSGGQVTVQTVTNLAGEGTLDAPVSVEDGGTVAPGLMGSTGVLSLGNTAFVVGANFNVEVNGVTTPGTDYDQLNVAGSVDITGATLNLSGTVSGTTLGDFVVLINNDGTDAVIGEFAGLAEGDPVTINSQMFRIFYDGGDGNDVVLAAVSATIGEVYVNDNFTGPFGTTITDADPNTAGDQTAVIGVNAFPTIQQGVDTVDDGGTVFVTDDLSTDGPGTYLENVSIGKNVMVIGTEGDPNAVIVDGDANGSVFSIAATFTVTLDGLTIQNGLATMGGGINTLGNLTLTNAAIQANIADGGSNAGRGGGIYLGSGTLSLDSSVAITGNRAMGGLTGGEGGGVYVETGTSLNLTGTQVTSNMATGFGGGVYNTTGGTLTLSGAVIGGLTAGNVAARGGGILNVGNATIDSTSQILGNIATDSGGGIFTANGMVTVGGGTVIQGNSAAVNGGGIFYDGGVLNLSSANIRQNTASGSSAGLGGGGLFIASGLSLDLLSGALIQGNVANGFNGNGGGILVDTGATLRATGTFIAGNRAGRAGGGIANFGGSVTLTDAFLGGPSSSLGNTASLDGGGLYNTGTALIQGGTQILSNVVLSQGGGIFNTGTLTVTGSTIGGTMTGNSAEEGAGVYNEGTATIDGGTTIVGNTAHSDGGGIYNTGDLTTDGVTIGSSTNGNLARRAGGGVFLGSTSTAMILNTTIIGNSATGILTTEGGGGIYNFGSTLTLDDTVVIRGNKAIGSGTVASGNGGGIMTLGGTVTLNGTTLRQNVAGRAGGGIENNDGTVILNNATLGGSLVTDGNAADVNGGGLHTSGAGTVTVNGGTVQNNVALNEGGGLWNSSSGTLDVLNGAIITGNVAEFGGGIFNDGNASNTVTVDGSTVSNNTANRFGGGLASEGGMVEIVGSMIIGNFANGSTAGDGGGGIYNVAGTLDINSASQISGNFATLNGGGVYNAGTATVHGGTQITNNSVLSQGGGIFNSGTLTVTGSAVGGATSGNSAEEGGGVYNEGTATLDGGTTILGNTANTDGGGIYNTGDLTTDGIAVGISGGGNTAGGAGGGIYLGSTSTATIINTNIAGNSATGMLTTEGGGGIYNLGSTLALDDTVLITDNTAIGGGSMASGNGGGIMTLGGIVTLNGTTLTKNVAGRAGGGIENNGGTVILNSATLGGSSIADGNTADVNGGGLHTSGVGTVTVNGGTVQNNVALNEGGGLWNSSGGALEVSNGAIVDSNFANFGGGIFNDGNATNTVTVDGSTISNNTADRFGGGLASEGGMVEITNSVVTNNTASGTISGDGGGGIYNLAGTLDIKSGSEFTSNSAAGDGGGVANLGGDLTIDGVTMGGTTAGNLAGRNGGGTYLGLGSGTVTITNTIIDENTANGAATTEGGGGIYVDGTTLNLDNTVSITNNIAAGGTATNAGNGGGIFNAGGMVMLTGTTLTGNSAGRAGGGIENNAGTVTLAGTVLGGPSAGSGNTAGINGGGLHTTGAGTVTVNGGTVQNNVALNEGGGLWNSSGGTLEVSNAALIDNNLADFGGGIFNDGSGPNMVTITTSTISNNTANRFGGGLANEMGMVEIVDSLVFGNKANGTTVGDGGGGLHNQGTATVTNTTISGNSSSADGGGVYTAMGTVIVNNTTIAENEATGNGGGILHDGTGSVTLTSTIVATNANSDISGTVGGTFNLVGVDTGLMGLMNGVDNNQVGTAASPIDPRLQPLADNGGPTLTHAILPDSPALDGGMNPVGLMFDQRGTPFVRTFGSGVDPNQTDIGAYELQGVNGGSNDIVAYGTGPGIEGEVKVLNSITQELLFTITPFPGFTGGVRVAVGDVDGDMVPDVIAAAGPGGGPHVKVYSGADGSLLSQFFAYDSGQPGEPGVFTGGVFVAAADLDSDGKADIITGAGAGAGPHVRAFSGADPSIQLFSFFAYDSALPGEPGDFSGGVHVAAGDITGDGIPDIITGAGVGGGPHVRVFDGAIPQLTGRGVDISQTLGNPLGSFFPYDMAFTGGVFVAAGDVNGDRQIDLITGAGPGGGPHVRVFDGRTRSQMVGDIGSFFAYDAGMPGEPGIFTGGVRVAATDITGDGKADIITAPGQGGGPNVRAFQAESVGPERIRNVAAADPAFAGGIFVAASTPLESTGTPLRLASGFIATGEAEPLTLTVLQPLYEAAVTRLQAAGLSADAVETLSNVALEVADLDGDRLGESLPGTIRLDINAAGIGWFIDSTPLTDEEFTEDRLNARVVASSGRVDLLTVVLHELIHELGGEHLDEAMYPGHLMAETLAPGQRRLASFEDLDQLFVNDNLLAEL